jgi:TolA-binding protein
MTPFLGALGLALLVPLLLAAPPAKSPTPESCAAARQEAQLMVCHKAALDLASLHEYQRAIGLEERVQERLPMNAEVAASLAHMYELGTTNTARAIALYHAALHASSGYPPALMGLGAIMQRKGEMDIAARYYGRAVNENPGQPLFKVRLAEVLVQSGRDSEAQPLLQEVVQKWPGSDEATSARKLMSRTVLAKP